MKKNINRVSVIIITVILIAAVCLGTISALSVNVNAEDKVIFNAYGLDFKESENKDLLILSKLETIENKIDEFLSRPVANITNKTHINNTVIKNTLSYNTINQTSPQKKDDSTEKTKKATEVLKEINKELPNLIKCIKNGTISKNYLENSDKMFSVISTTASMFGPKGQAVAAVIDIYHTIYNAVMGGTPAASENALMEDRLTQELNDIKNDLSEIENNVKKLSNELNESTQMIIEAMPAALKCQEDKKRLENFWNSYDGNFSYKNFYNYINGSLQNNSKSSAAYYALLQSALRNGGSDELIKRRYDNLYNAIENDIHNFENQIIPGNNAKSIVKTYYDYVSSNKEWLSKNQDTTPDMAAIEFAKELYQTLKTADEILAECYIYFYTQALLMQEDDSAEYFDYMGRFEFSFSDEEFESKYSEIDAREDNVRTQIAKDLAQILIGSNYVFEDSGNFYESTSGSVKTNQTVYLFEIKNATCKWFDLDPLDFKYVVKNGEEDSVQLENYNYFKVNGNTKICLQYKESDVLTFDFFTNSNKFAGGTGKTKDDPYLVSTAEQFLMIRDGLNDHYRLTTDIDFKDAAISPFGLSYNKNGGEVIDSFSGSLDGNGFSIKNLKVGQKGNMKAGLFAGIDKNGIVENLTFDNVVVESGRDGLDENGAELCVGIVTGYNSGTIRMCKFLNGSVSCVVKNTTNTERSFSVSAGGVAGKNNGIISACRLTGVEVTATSSHSFGGNAADKNKQFVYAGGIAGYNTGKIGFSYFIKNGNAGKVTAEATSTLSPKANVSAYVSALSGGICGKVDQTALESTSLSGMMTCLYTDVPTVGEANIEFSDSNYTKGFANRKENFNNERELGYLNELPDVIPAWVQWLVPWSVVDNALLVSAQKTVLLEELQKNPKESFEGNCYIPIKYGDYGNRITMDIIKSVKAESAAAVEAEIADFIKKEYEVEISGLPEGELSAATYNLDFGNLSAEVKKNGENVEVESVSVSNVYGFEALNKSKTWEKPMDVVFVLDISLKNGDHITHKATTNVTLQKNKHKSLGFEFSYGLLSWMQTNVNGIPYNENSALTLRSLHGMPGANAVYKYDVTTEEFIYDYFLVSKPVITVQRLTIVNGAQVVDETFAAHQSTDGTFYTDETGLYQATVKLKYDGKETDMVLMYEVYCPHRVFEAETYGSNCVNHFATCVDRGYNEYTCSLCNEKIQRDFTPATGIHFFNTEGYKEATCYSAGSTGYGKCSVCGLELGDSEKIPQLAHDYSVIVYCSADGTLIYSCNGKYYSNKACTQMIGDPSFRIENGRKVSYYHLCTHPNGKGDYHTEQHQYQKSMSVNDKGMLVYTYSCECGYHYSVEDTNTVTAEYIKKIPVISVSQGYALNGGDEVVVYVQLINNPGIYGANFGIRYDSRLILKSFEDGDVTEGSLVTDDHSISCGYNFVWANAGKREKDGNLLKLTFIVPDDAKSGDTYPVKVVYDIENGATGGLAVKVDGIRTTRTTTAVTEDGAVTIVDQLPGDVNRDGVVDILDAMELAKYSVGKIIADDGFIYRSDVDLNGISDVSDIVTILQALEGGYGVNLLKPDFTVKLDYNGVDPKALINGDALPLSIDVSLHGKNSTYDLPVPQREGYHFDGWYTRITDIADSCVHVEDGQSVLYDSYQRVQTLYAHWTKNTVTFNGNGAKSGSLDEWSGDGDFPNGTVFSKIYNINFKDEGLRKFEDENRTWVFELEGWSTSADGPVQYRDFEEIKNALKSVTFGGNKMLYAIWKEVPVEINGKSMIPNWGNVAGYETVRWYYGNSTTNEISFDGVVDYVNIIELLSANNSQYTIKAYYKKIEYTIIFDAGYGTGSRLCKKTIEDNTAADFPGDFSYTGHSIIGWGWNKDGPATSNIGTYGNIISLALQNGKVNSDGEIMLYALWNPKTYTVTLDRQSGSNGSPSVEATYNNTMPSINVPTRTGYVFGGYYSQTNGDGTQYYDQNGDSTKNWDIANTATLYAKWTKETYTLKFNENVNDAIPQRVIVSSGSISDTTITYGKTISLPTLQCCYFDFVGWKIGNSNETYTSLTVYDAGDNGTTIIASAVWRKRSNVNYIYNMTDLEKIRSDPNGIHVLMENISNAGSFTSIPTFGGTFDGNGKTISKLTVSVANSGVMVETGEVRGGFIGTNSGTIKNITFSSLTVYYVGTNPREVRVGGIAGWNDGTIYNCHIVNGSVEGNTGSDGIEDDFTSMTGGICGVNCNLIKRCSVTNLEVTGVANSKYNDCYVYVGGIAGKNNSRIISCVNNNSDITARGGGTESVYVGVWPFGTTYYCMVYNSAGGIVGNNGPGCEVSLCEASPSELATPRTNNKGQTAAGYGNAAHGDIIGFQEK